MMPVDVQPTLKSAARRLDQAFVALNFRREPIYPTDESIEMENRYHRYAISCRKVGALQNARHSFLDRAIHTSIDGWQKQVETILQKFR
jgi:hypothetical protein